MATITQEELKKLKSQFNALISAKGGKNRAFDIFYRLIANGPQPKAEFFDPNMYGVGYGGMQPAETLTIANARKNRLLSETPADKSIWYRVNYELADVTLNTEKLIRGTTGDERRIIRDYANTLSAPERQRLLDALKKAEPAEQVDKFDLPDITE